MRTLDAAVEYLGAGLSVLPIKQDGSKRPAIRAWGAFQQRRMTAEEVETHFANGVGVAIIGGAVSGGLEVLDFDAASLFTPWRESVEAAAPRLVERLVRVETPRPGVHLYYRAPQVEGNQKLARGESGETAMETRGEGGYVLAPGSPPACHPTHREYRVIHGSLLAIPTITSDERGVLLAAARAFDRMKHRTPTASEMRTPATMPPLPERMRRAAAYLEKIPGAVEGAGGDHRTWGAALAVGRGFALPPAVALDLLLREYNPRCTPPWSEKELRHKIECATSKSKLPLGYLLNAAVDGGGAFGASGAVTSPVPPVAAWQPFPLDVLPEPMKSLSVSGAAAIGCDPSFVAVPALAAAAAAVGNARRVCLKAGWDEPAVVWAAIVGRSGGARKSPGLDLALRPLREADTRAVREHATATEELGTSLREWERKLADFKRGKADDPGNAPAPASCRRHVISDATLEAIAPILRASPRGVLLARDELSGWFGSFDQYRARGRGGDVPAWLEAHRAGPIRVDRKTGERHIAVARGFVGVVGTIQPGTLSSCLTPEYRESGLAARLLLAFPPARRREWSDATLDPDAVRAYAEMIDRLLGIPMGVDDEGESIPKVLPLSPEARGQFAKFVNELGDVAARAGDDEAAALAKIEGYAPRFALVFALCDDPNVCEVNEAAMRRGIALATWFAREIPRCHGLLRESVEEENRRRLAEWIGDRGGTVTVHDVQRNLRRFALDAELARAALLDLERHGFGAFNRSAPGAQGGRPTETFTLRIGMPETPQEPRPAADNTDKTAGVATGEPKAEQVSSVLSASAVDAQNGWPRAGHPNPCAACGGADFWRSVHGGMRCRTCHPPADPGLEARA